MEGILTVAMMDFPWIARVIAVDEGRWLLGWKTKRIGVLEEVGRSRWILKRRILSVELTGIVR